MALSCRDLRAHLETEPGLVSAGLAMVAWAPPMHEVLCLQGSGTQTPDGAGHSPPGSPVLLVSGLA